MYHSKTKEIMIRIIMNEIMISIRQEKRRVPCGNGAPKKGRNERVLSKVADDDDVSNKNSRW